MANSDARPRLRPTFDTLGWLGLLLIQAGLLLAQHQRGYDFLRDPNPPDITEHDIANFRRIDADLYCGGRPRSKAYMKLVKLGIRTIINLEEPEFADREQAAIQVLNQGLEPEAQIEFISFPINQTAISETGVSDERMRQLFKQIIQARKPIFLHCYLGKHRTSAIVAIYRMKWRQKPLKEAYEEASRNGLSQSAHGLWRTIERYQSDSELENLPGR